MVGAGRCWILLLVPVWPLFHCNCLADSQHHQRDNVPVITGFELVNVQTNETVQPLRDFDIIDVLKLGTTQLTVRVAIDGNVDRLYIDIDHGTILRTLTVPPYAIAGSSATSGQLHASHTLTSSGAHTITVTPRPSRETTSVTFTVISKRAVDSSLVHSASRLVERRFSEVGDPPVTILRVGSEQNKTVPVAIV